MRLTYSIIISALGIVVAIVVILAHAGLFFSIATEQAPHWFVNLVVTTGCRFDVFAIPLLALVFVFFGLELSLLFRDTAKKHPDLSFGKRFRRTLLEKSDASEFIKGIAATGSFLLVVFFVSQLSYLVNHCQT